MMQGRTLMAAAAAVLMTMHTASAAQPAGAANGFSHTPPRQQARSRSGLQTAVYRVTDRQATPPSQHTAARPATTSVVTQTVRCGVMVDQPAPTAAVSYQNPGPARRYAYSSSAAAPVTPRYAAPQPCRCGQPNGVCTCENCTCENCRCRTCNGRQCRSRNAHGPNCQCQVCRGQNCATCGAAPGQCRCRPQSQQLQYQQPVYVASAARGY